MRALCDRHCGVGADGILEPAPTDRADHGVRIWNPDGSIAEKSGNGLRIFAFWLARDRGAGAQFRVDTGTDVVGCAVDGTEVTVQMGSGRVLWREAVAGLPVVAVSVGNPHAVVWRREADLDSLPWRDWGATLETHPRFAARTNVQIAASRGRGALEIRIWERGAGETSASGSSACAVAMAAIEDGLQPADAPLTIRAPGGPLTVTVHADRTLTLVGPVAPVGTIALDPGWC